MNTRRLLSTWLILSAVSVAAYVIYGFRFVRYVDAIVDISLSKDGWVYLSPDTVLLEVRVKEAGFNKICVTGITSSVRVSRDIHKSAPGFIDAAGNLCLYSAAIEEIALARKDVVP
jgi:hypothetical protein